MSTSIILIGPGKAGKTTLSAALGEAMNRPSLDLDKLRWDYYAEIGYDAEKAKVLRREGGMKAIAAYWKPFDVHGVERILQDYPHNHVIAFGAGHSVYDDEAQFARVQAALAPFPHVMLLQPFEDVEQSVAATRARLQADEPNMNDSFYNIIADFNRYFITHPSNRRLAKHVIYNGDRTVSETVTEIAALVQA